MTYLADLPGVRRFAEGVRAVGDFPIRRRAGGSSNSEWSLSGGCRISASSSRDAWDHGSLDLVPDRLGSQVQLIALLQIHPESGAHAQPLFEPERGVGRHRALSGDQLIESIRWNMQRPGQLGRCHFEFCEFPGEHFTWVNWIDRSLFGHNTFINPQLLCSCHQLIQMILLVPGNKIRNTPILHHLESGLRIRATGSSRTGIDQHSQCNILAKKVLVF